jgi:hypothetical protein
LDENAESETPQAVQILLFCHERHRFLQINGLWAGMKYTLPI